MRNEEVKGIEREGRGLTPGHTTTLDAIERIASKALRLCLEGEEEEERRVGYGARRERRSGVRMRGTKPSWNEKA